MLRRKFKGCLPWLQASLLLPKSRLWFQMVLTNRDLSSKLLHYWSGDVRVSY